MRLPRLLPLLLSGTLAAVPAQAETGFSAADAVGWVLRLAVPYGRLVSDLRYDALEVDAARGAVTLRGLRVAGLGRMAACQVDLGRLELSGLTLLGAEDMRSRIELADLRISANCFGTDALSVGMVTGTDAIQLDSLVIDAHQVVGSGLLSLDVVALAPGMARVEASANFDYASLIAPGVFDDIRRDMAPFDGGLGYDKNGNPILPPPAPPEVGLRGVLRAAHVSVEDLGLWGRVQVLLPPEAIRPETVRALATGPEGSALRATQDSLVAALSGFVAAPGVLTMEIRPAQPVAFDSTDWTAGPEAALALLRPVFTNAPPTPPVALIAAPEGNDALALGLALAEGRGLPQSTPRAIAVLASLVDDPQALLALAGLQAATDPVLAYGHAQRAAALGAPGAQAALDRIEAFLPTPDLLAAQAPADAAVPGEVFASARALRDAARAYAEGDGVPRSYVLARRLAGSAAAAGDGLAQALLARLDARFGTDPDWIAARDAAAEQAMGDWTGQDLAARFSAR